MIDPRTSIEGIRDYILEVDAHTVITLDLVYGRILKAIEDTNVKNITRDEAVALMDALKEVFRDDE